MLRTLPLPNFLMFAWLAASCSTSSSALVDAGRAGTGGSKTGTGGAGAEASGGASGTGGAGAEASGGASGVGGAGAAASGGASGTGGAGAEASGGASGTGGAGAAASGGAGGTGARDAAVDSVPDAGAPGSDACVFPDAQAGRLLDLNVRGEGFDVHNGRTIRVFTREQRAGILGTASATIVAGGFSVRFPGGYVRNASVQGVSWFVDEDGDGACDQSKGDDLGYRAIDPFDPPDLRALDLIVQDDHASSPRIRGACDGTRPFEEMSDMDITATGFAAHDGATVRLLTRTGQNGAVFGAGQTTIAGGKFSLHFPSAYQQFTYQEILWFVDIDGDGVCTIADHRGGVSSSAFTPTGSAAVTMPITDNHMTTTTRSADLCAIANGCQLAP